MKDETLVFDSYNYGYCNLVGSAEPPQKEYIIDTTGTDCARRGKENHCL